MQQTIKLNNGFVFTFTDDREWIYKAEPTKQIVKPVVKEKPFLKVVEEIEQSYKEEFDRTLANCMKEISSYLDV